MGSYPNQFFLNNLLQMRMSHLKKHINLSVHDGQCEGKVAATPGAELHVTWLVVAGRGRGCDHD